MLTQMHKMSPSLNVSSQDTTCIKIPSQKDATCIKVSLNRDTICINVSSQDTTCIKIPALMCPRNDTPPALVFLSNRTWPASIYPHNKTPPALLYHHSRTPPALMHLSRTSLELMRPGIRTPPALMCPVTQLGPWEWSTNVYLHSHTLLEVIMIVLLNKLIETLPNFHALS